MRVEVTPKLTLWGAASKALSRPSFANLSLGLFLGDLFKPGSAGNPALGPLKTNLYELFARLLFLTDQFRLCRRLRQACPRLHHRCCRAGDDRRSSLSDEKAAE